MAKIFYDLVWWGLFIASAVFAVIDIARAKIDSSSNDDTIFLAGEIITMVAISVIVAKGMLTLQDFNSATSNQVVRIIALCVLTMPLRRILDIFIYGMVMYLMDVDNELRQRLEQKLIVTNTITGKKSLSIGVLRLYHLAMYICCLAIYTVCAAFPKFTAGRMNVTVNFWSRIFEMATGTNGQQILFMLWLISLLVLVCLIVIYLFKLYKNFIRLVEKKYSEIKAISKLRWFIIWVFVVRKIYIYIFIMTNYQLADILFWWIVSLLICGISFAWWYYNTSRGNTIYHIA